MNYGWDRHKNISGGIIFTKLLYVQQLGPNFKNVTNSVYMLALRCRCARNFFKNGGKFVAMVTTYANNIEGKKHFQIKLGTHVHFEV